MFNILLVPLDGSPQSVHVVNLASRVAAPGSATVHLLCVVDPSYALPPGCESGVAPDGLTYPFANAETAFARSVLAAAAAQLADRNLTVEQHFCTGNPADVVIGQARELAAEVIVMGHHHLSRLRRWANPSTSGEVIERSPCAVLIEIRDYGQPHDFGEKSAPTPMSASCRCFSLSELAKCTTCETRFITLQDRTRGRPALCRRA
jgi:nucleotide-binding universal stress UspA family protein